MGKGKKPTGKVEVTLLFDSQDQADWFSAYWLDGGGDQQLPQIHTDKWGKNWYYLKTDENACTKCGYLSPYFYDTNKNTGDVYQCDNCPNKYALK